MPSRWERCRSRSFPGRRSPRSSQSISHRPCSPATPSSFRLAGFKQWASAPWWIPMQGKSGCMCLPVWDGGRWCILKTCGSRSRPAVSKRSTHGSPRSKTGSQPAAGSRKSSRESLTPLSSTRRPIRPTPITRAACSSTISATSRSVRALPGRFPTTRPGRPPRRKSFSRCPRCPETRNSGFRRVSDHRPGRT